MNTNSVTVPISGMVSDSHSMNLDDKSYKYALNAAIEDFDGNGLPLLQNVHSNILAIELPEGFKIIGRKVIVEQDRVILMLVNPIIHKSEIGEYKNCSFTSDTDTNSGDSCVGCDNNIGLGENTPLEETTQTTYCTYRKIAGDDCLAFNIDFPVDIEYKITDCTLNIYFTDNLNERRYIYFDYTNGLTSGDLIIQQHFYTITGYTDDDCTLPIYSTDLDCNKIKYHPNYTKPCIDFVDVLPGGVLKSGSYQALFAYADVIGNPLSNYTPGTQIVPLRVKDITIETDYQTSRSLKFQFTNIDQSGVFEYYNFVIAETIDNFTEFKLIGTFPINVDFQVYTGNNPALKKLTAEDIFFRRPYYAKAKSVTKSNDYLFFGSPSEFSKPNLQPLAEMIKFQWQTVAIKESVYADPKNTFYFRGYMRDEVYPLGLVFEGANGEELCAIHIPGPSKDYFMTYYGIDVDVIINNRDVLNDVSCDPNLRNKKWEVYNLAQITDSPHLFTDNCFKIQVWESGDFSYWESEERYPNIPEIWGNLCGQKIRHHKFPDNCVSHIHDGHDTNKGFNENNIVFPIGVKVDEASVTNALLQGLNTGIITQEQYDRIKSYRIVRGNRAQHKSIIAKGLLYDVWDYDKYGKKYYYPNYPYNDIRNDVYIGSSSATYNTPDSDPSPYLNHFRRSGRYTFHSPDTHFTNPKLGTELKLETVEYGKSEGYFNECLLQAKYRFLSTASYIIALATGVAAALSATTEKECTTYELKADYKTTQVSDGHMPYPNITGHGNINGTVPGAIIGNSSISTSAGSGNFSEGERREAHNNPYNNNPFQAYDPQTGLPTGTPLNVESYTKTTCKGTTYQELNKPGILTILTGAIGLGTESVQGLVYRISIALFEMKKVVDLLDSLIPNKNLAIQYNSVGKYNNWTCVPNYIGIKRRKINRAVYLDPTIQTINEAVNSITQVFTTINFNNWNRESSVYIKLAYDNIEDTFLPTSQLFPSLADQSRFTLGQVGGYNDLNKIFTSPISSYYGSIKNYVPDQYGNIYSIDYLDTSSCNLTILAPEVVTSRVSNVESPVVFGGDTFINRFALKRKMPFFTQTAFKFENQEDIRYEDLGNVGFPNYYFDTPGTLMETVSSFSSIVDIINPANIPSLFGVPRNRMDVDTHATFFYQKGKIYLYSYGVPYFFVESDINTDYRHGQNNLEKDYYPHKSDLNEWLQEKYVPIKEDNYYFYNNSFSKQDKESVICINKATFSPNKICKTTFPQRLIYSEQSLNAGSTFDNWLIFKANNFHDFALTDGELITADGIENDKILVRFENTSSIFAAYNTIQTDGASIQVGNGGIFASRPKEFSSSDLGYFGSQHRSLLRTEFGHIWVDAKRGQVFNLASDGTGVDEISKYGKRNWFKENLPFQLHKDFKIIENDDLDNNYKGIGLHMSFDKRFNRFFLTKLDYKVKDGRVQYDDVAKEFFYRDEQNVRIVVLLSNTTFFCNKSWTISYNFITKSWVSYHSFLPNVYIDWVDYFQSHIDNTIWSHNLTNKSYQVYYGKLYPFIIQTQSKPTYGKSFLNNIEYMMDSVRYHNNYDSYHNDQVTFNKAIISTNKQCTGMVELNLKNHDDLSEIGTYPKTVAGGTRVQITNREGFWSINDFHDCTISQYNNVPFFVQNCAASKAELNPLAFNYYKADLNKTLIRNDYFDVMFINDKYSNYHMTFKHLTNKANKSV